MTGLAEYCISSFRKPSLFICLLPTSTSPLDSIISLRYSLIMRFTLLIPRLLSLFIVESRQSFRRPLIANCKVSALLVIMHESELFSQRVSKIRSNILFKRIRHSSKERIYILDFLSSSYNIWRPFKIRVSSID